MELIGKAKKQSIGDIIEKNVNQLSKLSKDELKLDRIKKYFKIGSFENMPAISPMHSEKSHIPDWNEAWEDVESFLGLQ